MSEERKIALTVNGKRHEATVPVRLTLADFLQRCDLVKFAKFEPTEAALRDLYEVASRLVDETRYDPIAGLGGAETPTPPEPAVMADNNPPPMLTKEPASDTQPAPPVQPGTAPSHRSAP